MTASEVVDLFFELGVLDYIARSSSGEVVLITASAPEETAKRSMNVFRELPGYYRGENGIDGFTTDDVRVVMTFL